MSDSDRGGEQRPVAAVIGLGLIGGSVARELAKRGWRVLGADAEPETLRAAEQEGVVEPLEPLDAAVAGADPRGARLVVVAVPASAAPGVLRRVAEWASPETVVTDVASTKRSTLEAAGAAGLDGRFVGSHPMAGDHRSGWSASRIGLFRGARVWLCPGDGGAAGPGKIRPGGEAHGALAAVAGFWRSLGADPAVIDAAEHDRQVAWASHLPQAVASALAAVLDGAAVPRSVLGPGGRDVTRLAGSQPGLWRDILMDNRDEVEAAVGALIDELTVLRRALVHGDEASLHALLTAGRGWAEAAEAPVATS